MKTENISGGQNRLHAVLVYFVPSTKIEILKRLIDSLLIKNFTYNNLSLEFGPRVNYGFVSFVNLGSMFYSNLAFERLQNAPFIYLFFFSPSLLLMLSPHRLLIFYLAFLS